RIFIARGPRLGACATVGRRALDRMPRDFEVSCQPLLGQTTCPDKMIESTVATQYWHRLPTGEVQCDVCPRHCKLNEGQRGLCFVRAREGDAIVLTTFGRSSGFCVDPIEKKPLNHFLPGTPVLSFGTAG